MNKITLDSFVN